MKISIIVAMAADGLIGTAHNEMPWQMSLPADLKHFRQKTMGKPIIMGRKTYASIGRPLPGRDNIILSRDAGFAAPGCVVVSDTAAALAAAAAADEVMIIGGASIYRQFLPRTDYLYLTIVEAEFEGSVYFPPLDFSQWQRLGVEHHAADENNRFPYRFEEYQRQPR